MIKHLLHIGPQKTASSLIHSLVCRKGGFSHPIKENFYFQLSNSFSYSKYLSIILNGGDFAFDCSPSYFCDPSTIDPIRNVLPCPTIIVGLRDVNKLFTSFAKHQYSLGLITARQLQLSQFNPGFFDPVRYSLYAPSWLSSFENIFLLDVDTFLSSLDYRLNVMNKLFPSLKFESSDLIQLQSVNEAHAYRFGLGHLRRFTPYVNSLPYSHQIVRLKKTMLNYLPRQVSTPTPNLCSPEIQSIIRTEIDYSQTLSSKFGF